MGGGIMERGGGGTILRGGIGGGGTKLGGRTWFFIRGGGGFPTNVGGLMGCFGSILNENWRKNCFVSLFQCVQNLVSDLSTSLLGTLK